MAIQRTSVRLLTGVAVAAGVATALVYRGGRPPVRWSSRVVLITGGSRGLGLALGRELVDAGAIVWVVSRDADSVARAVEDLRARGGRAYGIAADITDGDAVGRMVTEVATKHGRLDCIVNNAGVITAMPFANSELADFAESLDTHFWGPLHVIRAALPWLRRSGDAQIVNVSSVGGRVGVPHLSPYCAGKFALTGLSEVLTAELAADGIQVTTVTPGLMRTGSIRQVKVRGQQVPEAIWFAALAKTPLTSKSATRAARQIVRAVSSRRATVTPGWQARVLHLFTALLPELAAPVHAAVTAHLLPEKSATPTDAASIGALDLGWADALRSPSLEADYNQR